MIAGQLSHILLGVSPLRMRDVVAIGQQYRRRHDGLVIHVENVHRADRTAEVEAEPPREPSGPWRVPARFSVSFDQLRREYQLLVSLEKTR